MFKEQVCIFATFFHRRGNDFFQIAFRYAKMIHGKVQYGFHIQMYNFFSAKVAYFFQIEVIPIANHQKKC
jgi:hypothetical protein